MFGNPRSLIGKIAKTLSFSLFPRHEEILKQRQRELNVPKSLLVQLLLEVESRDGILRRELINRLTSTNPGQVAP